MNLKRKSFIWAHNEHINKREMYYSGSNIINRSSFERLLQRRLLQRIRLWDGKNKGYVLDKKNKGNGKHFKKNHLKKHMLTP
jgi:erythromycin esterase